MRDHKWYMSGRMITVHDIYSFDPNVHVELEEFTDIIGRNFRQPEQGLGFDNSPVAHMWRAMIRRRSTSRPFRLDPSVDSHRLRGCRRASAIVGQIRGRRPRDGAFQRVAPRSAASGCPGSHPERHRSAALLAGLSRGSAT